MNDITPVASRAVCPS